MSNPHLEDDDAPELTPALRAMLRPAAEVLSPEVMAQFNKPAMGRPKVAAPKVPVSLRLPPALAAYYRSLGKGWQGHVEEALIKAMPKEARASLMSAVLKRSAATGEFVKSERPARKRAKA